MEKLMDEALNFESLRPPSVCFETAVMRFWSGAKPRLPRKGKTLVLFHNGHGMSKGCPTYGDRPPPKKKKYMCYLLSLRSLHAGMFGVF